MQHTGTLVRNPASGRLKRDAECHINDWVALLARQDRHDAAAREL